MQQRTVEHVPQIFKGTAETMRLALHEQVQPTPAVSCAPFPVIECDFCHAKSKASSRRHHGNRHTNASSDTTGFVHPQFSTTAVEASASHVIGSLPVLDEFAVPVYNQIRQEQIVAEQERVQQHTAEQFAHLPV